MRLEARLRELYAEGELEFPFPAAGRTSERHQKLIECARADLAVARLAEAHADALAIMAEAARTPRIGLYGVWAAETAGQSLLLEAGPGGIRLNGTKMFCSGAGLIDRALITVEGCLVDVNLRDRPESFSLDQTGWKTCAFADTNTATIHFSGTPVDEVIGEQDWYLKRPGFWHGACGPAACWAGGAMGLFDYALKESRDDAHTMAHLGAMSAAVWAMKTFLDCAGREIDNDPANAETARARALTVRHLIEESCSNILRRLGRAFGPRPLAFDSTVSKRYQEVELYIRQSHAEHDLESLGRDLRSRMQT